MVPFPMCWWRSSLEPRAAFRVVAVPDLDPFQPDGLVQLLQRLVNASFADDVISGDVGMAGINAGGSGNNPVQTIEHFSDLFEAAAERELGPGGILDENGQSAFN